MVWSVIANASLVIAVAMLIYILHTFISTTRKELKKLQDATQNLNIEAAHAREMILKVNAAIHLIRRIDLDKYKADYKHKDCISHEDTVEIIQPRDLESAPIGPTRCMYAENVDWSKVFKDQSDMMIYLEND